jgi:hypothetical protein
MRFIKIAVLNNHLWIRSPSFLSVEKALYGIISREKWQLRVRLVRLEVATALQCASISHTNSNSESASEGQKNDLKYL